MVLREWWSRLSVMGLISLIGLLAIIICVVFAPPLLGTAAEEGNILDANLPPSAQHWLGTDALGRDSMLRTLVAVQLSVVLALVAVFIGVVIGVPVGALTAMLNGRIRTVVVFLIDTAVAFPPLLSAIFFSVLLGIGPVPAAFAIGFAYVPYFARFSRTLASDIGGADYLAAAKMMGVTRVRRLTQYVLPNIAEPLVVKSTMAVGGAVLAFAGLSFLGLGIQPPAYDLGRLLGNGLDYIYINPVAALAPATAVVLIGLVFNYLGEYLAAELGQRNSSRRRAVRAAATLPIVPPKAPAQERPVTIPARDTVLSIRGLRVGFRKDDSSTVAIGGIDLDIARGEIVGIVGESGSGKSVTSLAVTDLLPANAEFSAESFEVCGTDMLGSTRAIRRRALKRHVSLVFQDPSAYLNPSMRVGRQLLEAGQQDTARGRRAARSRAIALMSELQIVDAAKKFNAYAYEFSGGMKQRLMIAMGMMSSPDLLIADEPTTALDVTVQRKILGQLRDLRDTHGTSVVLISHDLGVISHTCDRVVVMYGGVIVEELAAEDVANARHPYTRALLGASPEMTTPRDAVLATIRPRTSRASQSCVFADRCDFATEQCQVEAPALEWRDATTGWACWNVPHDDGADAREKEKHGVI